MDSDKDLQRIYSAGDCPVCADSGAMLLLKARGSGRMFFFCPLCGVAWPHPPRAAQLDSVFGLTNFAPSGVVLPTLEEGFSTDVGLTEVSFDVWHPFLRDLLS